MCDVILAVIERPETARQTLDGARRLADLMQSARINVLAPRLPPEATILPTEEVLTAHKAEQIRAREQARIVALRPVFDEWRQTAQDAQVTVDWADIEGPADLLTAEWGRRADIVVLDRPIRREGRSDPPVVQAALFDTDRPVLMMPPGPVAGLGRCVAIAWRDDPRAIRAVLAARRLLAPATEVHVLTGVREGAPPPRLPDILAEHDIAATLHVLPVGPGVFGAELLARAHALGADMLVMGAYAHRPWRELILGGVTRHMLGEADLPVFMRH
ncbi:Universal stress protein [Rhodovastum atsumiense]|uniref:Universal stress protein n=1 Tax=Rhodovastum atsumiense TaxID=504468 RepID=A0A5M6IY19_9PROT|nr:universal stress protein [Rhodovastum atsumiense]KAA5612859.1 universal stress protein [Rhodovastum atsumiense]CAH2601072.1 Universal stress protein [Rhodovastum atsumiense]